MNLRRVFGPYPVVVVMLSLLIPAASAGPPPVVPLTTCLKDLCLKIVPAAPATLDRIVVETSITLRQSIMRGFIKPGVEIAIVTKQARDVRKDGSSQAFTWAMRSDTLAVASACLACEVGSEWTPQWVGIAVQAQSPEQLMLFLTTAEVIIRPIELYGHRVDESTVLSLGPEENVFRTARKFGKWMN